MNPWILELTCIGKAVKMSVQFALTKAPAGIAVGILIILWMSFHAFVCCNSLISSVCPNLATYLFNSVSNLYVP